MTHRLASWLALVAMLVAMPAAAFGRFECSFGMTQAGPSCPLCHGESGPPIAGPSIDGQCCKYVDANVAPAENAASSHQPTRSLAPLSWVASAEDVAAAPGRRASSGPNLDRAEPSKPSPLYLSNHLRL